MKEFICIICPRGCRLKVENNIYEVTVTGNHCKRGYKYALQEYTNPTRTVTLNIKVEDGESPVVSVKTKEPIAQSKVMPLAILAKKLKVKAPIKEGDVLYQSLLGAELVATKTVNKAEK